MSRHPDPSADDRYAPAPGPGAAADAAAARIPLIGIALDASGRAALLRFLAGIPAGSGAAFVVMDGDPDQPPLAERQRACALPVVALADGQVPAADQVLVVPAGFDLRLADATLGLERAAGGAGGGRALTAFFATLADQLQQHAIGVLLAEDAGAGSSGLARIRDQGGFTAVLASAHRGPDGEGDGDGALPLADVAAEAHLLPASALAAARRSTRRVRHDLAASDPGEVHLGRLLELLLRQTGHDFSLYKKTTLYRRIERRMGQLRIVSLADYARHLEQDPGEGAFLFQEMLICVTRFFRDPEVWEQLRDEVLPALMRARPEGGTLRAWIAGCANGEEAYSLAMVFLEAVGQGTGLPPFSLQIFATDLNGTAINRARRGHYPGAIAEAVSPARLERFFHHDARGWRVKQELRDLVIFAQHSLLADPPFTRLDLLSCRNVMIYLAPDVHETLLPRFHFSLNPGGILMLGSSESVGAGATLFAPLPGTGQLYQRLDARQQPQPGLTTGFTPLSSFMPLMPLSRSANPMNTNAIANLQVLADQLLLQRYAPAAVLVSRTGNILHISGRTGRYLEPASGKANWNVLAMAREGLAQVLSEAFYEAQRQQAAVTLTAVQPGDDGGSRTVDITVQPLAEPAALQGMLMVVFADATAQRTAPPLADSERSARQSDRLKSMEQALNALREELQNTREEAQTSREELTSTNEELQSTNEELTTSAEELRTMNEELQRARAAAESSLARYTDLFASAPVGYVTMDVSGVVTQANLVAIDLLGLGRDLPAGGILALFIIEADRPRFDACCQQAFASRTAQACEVALWRANGAARTVRISALAADDGRTCRVVVVDLTEIRASEAALRESEERFRNLADHAPVLIWMAGPDLQRTHVNQGWLDFTGRSQAAERGAGWADRIHPDDRVQVLATRASACDARSSFSLEYRLQRQDGEYRWLLDTANPRFSDQGTFLGYVGSCTDITARKQAELATNQERLALEALAQGGPLPDLLRQLVLCYEALLPGMRGAVTLLEADHRQLRLVAAPNLPLPFRQAIETVAIGAGNGSCGAAAERGRPTLVADIANDPLWRNLQEVARAHALGACWSVPIQGAGRRLLGTLAFYGNAPASAAPEDVATMERAAHLAGQAIERQLSETALATTSELLTLTGAMAKIGGWQLAPQSGRLQWTREVFRIHELESAQPPSLDEAIAFFSAEAQPVIRGLIQKGIDRAAPWDVELPLQTAKGRRIWVCMQGNAVGAAGQVTRLHGTLQDITARKALEEELRQAHKLEAVGRLAGGIAHDFNNQLTVIQGYGTMALNKTRDETVGKYLGQVVNAAKRSADLVRQLLTFSRKGVHAMAPVDLHALIQELIEVLGRSLNKLIHIGAELKAERAVVMGDAGLLQNALLNLALNARDAMPSGGELRFLTRVVELDETRSARLGTSLAPGRYLQLTVRDTGRGMSDEVQKHLFEPFFSTKSPGQGTGLGLASVYGTLALHRGGIEVASSLGHGTSFELYLPASGSIPGEVPTATFRRPPPLTTVHGRILVVDDEEAVSFFASDSLTSCGHQVVCKADGVLALEYYREHWRDLDLVILDMNMPRMSGPETFAALRAVNPQAKVLIMSGFSADGGVKDLIRQGALGFIAKPFQQDAFANQVAHALTSDAPGCP